jgi:hypothetical protein
MAQRLLFASVALQLLGLFLQLYGAVMLTLLERGELIRGASLTTTDPLRPLFYVFWVAWWPAFQIVCMFWYIPSLGGDHHLQRRTAFPNSMSFLAVALVSEALQIPFTRDAAYQLLAALKASSSLTTPHVNSLAVLAAGSALLCGAQFVFIMCLTTLLSEQHREVLARLDRGVGITPAAAEWPPAVGVVVHRATVTGTAANAPASAGEALR